MNKVEISHAGIDQRLEWSQGHALEDTSPQKARGVLPTCSGPGAAHNRQNVSDQEQMAFAPDTRCGHDKDPGHAHAAQVVPGQQSRSLKCDLLIVCDCDRVGSQNGTEGCAEHCHEGQNRKDEIASP